MKEKLWLSEFSTILRVRKLKNPKQITNTNWKVISIAANSVRKAKGNAEEQLYGSPMEITTTEAGFVAYSVHRWEPWLNKGGSRQTELQGIVTHKNRQKHLESGKAKLKQCRILTLFSRNTKEGQDLSKLKQNINARRNVTVNSFGNLKNDS